MGWTAALHPLNYFPRNFLSIPSNILTISFRCEAGICRVRRRSCDHERALHTTIGVERTQETRSNSTAASELREEVGIPSIGSPDSLIRTLGEFWTWGEFKLGRILDVGRFGTWGDSGLGEIWT